MNNPHQAKRWGLSPLKSSCESLDTQVSNTGFIFTLSIDYLRGTVPLNNFDKLIKLVQTTFSDLVSPCLTLDGRPLGNRFYTITYKSVLGIYLATHPRTSSSTPQLRSDCLLDISGSILNSISYPRIRRFFQALSILDFSPSRIDVAFDDYSLSYTPMDAYQAYLAGYVSPFIKHRWLSSGTIKKMSTTLELGSRGDNSSGAFVRIYDDKSSFTRLEIEYSKQKADDIFLCLCICTSLSDWPHTMASFISASIDFRIRSPKISLSACPRVPFWSRIMDGVSTATFSPRIVINSLAKTYNWLERQVAPSLALIIEAELIKNPHSDDLNYVYDLWDSGSTRFSDKHKFLLEQFKLSFTNS